MWHLKKYIINPNFLQNVKRSYIPTEKYFLQTRFLFSGLLPYTPQFWPPPWKCRSGTCFFSGFISRMRFSWVRVTILYLSIILTCMAYMAFDNLTDLGGFCPNGVDRGKSKPLLRQGRKIQISHCVLQNCRWKKKVSENRLHFSPFDNSILAAA